MSDLATKIRAAVEAGRMPDLGPAFEQRLVATMGDSYTLYRELMDEYAHATELQLVLTADGIGSSCAAETMVHVCRRHKMIIDPRKLPRLAKALSETP